MKNSNILKTLIDTREILHLVNPAHVVAIYPTGGTVGIDDVVCVELSSGKTICAIGFGSGPSALENCAEQLGMICAE